MVASCKSKTESKEVPEEVARELPVEVKGEEVSYGSDSTNLKGYIAYDMNADVKSWRVLELLGR